MRADDRADGARCRRHHHRLARPGLSQIEQADVGRHPGHAEIGQHDPPRFRHENLDLDSVRSLVDGADAAVDKALRLDSTVMLVDDPVKRVDNMTMAWGLEARVPFLDHELVELSARIPAEFKVKGGGKYVLKETARKIIPEGVIDRPKGYFPVPALKYIRGEYRELVKEVLGAPAARERELLQREYVEILLEKPDDHITPLRGSKLWQAALLEFWLQTHGV